MSRKKREFLPRFLILCEGDTEYNYIDEMKNISKSKLILKPVNMKGGGYKTFL